MIEINRFMKQPELGKKIAELRQNKGLTQSELADNCKISLRTVQRIESAEVTPRGYTINIIFTYLGYDNEFFNNSQYFVSEKTNWFKQIFTNNVIEFFNLKTEQMKRLRDFLKDFFLTIGVLWFFCGLSILLFNLNFGAKEIVLTLIIPLAYAIVKQFDLNRNSKEKIE